VAFLGTNPLNTPEDIKAGKWYSASGTFLTKGNKDPLVSVTFSNLIRACLLILLATSLHPHCLELPVYQAFNAL
jgi:hypothetical protein